MEPPDANKKRSVSQMDDTDATESSSDGSDHREGSEDVETPDHHQPSIFYQRRATNTLQNCRDVNEFKLLKIINSGTYGVVYKARDKKTGEVVAMKRLTAEIEDEGFPMNTLREINILYSLSHPSVVDVKEVVVGSSIFIDSVFLVMEHMEHELKGFMEGMIEPFNTGEVKRLMKQLIGGVDYLHNNWIIHRDLKTANLLLDKEGNLKICDFGLSRRYGSETKPYTQPVVTFRYRAHELLLGATEYTTAIDMWSVGCIMAEILAREPLFHGIAMTDMGLLNKMFDILGAPDETTWPGLKNLPGGSLDFREQPKNHLKEKFPPISFSGQATLSNTGHDLLNRLLTYDPNKRITAKDALAHAWFTEEPLPQDGVIPADLRDLYSTEWQGWL